MQGSLCQVIQYLEETPVVAAVKNHEGLEKSLCSDSRIVFVLYGDVNSIPEITQRIQAAGKLAFVHIDLLDGLSAREAAVDYIRRSTSAVGVISTKPGLIRYARSLGFVTVQRFFVLDSLALENVRRADSQDAADFVEILPGLMPKIIRRLADGLRRPVIAGGLISDKEDVVTALGAGAIAISSTNADVWFM